VCALTSSTRPADHGPSQAVHVEWFRFGSGWRL